jgi:hypothetical protein
MFDDDRKAQPSETRVRFGPARGGTDPGGAAQPEGELLERKSKEMKAKMLSFPFNNFSESRLFRGLRPIQIQKF